MKPGRGLEILTAAESRAAERQAIERGTPALALMERAGAAVAAAIVARFTPRETLVLCGPGNNGGDGYVVARLLKERGWNVRVLQLGAPKTADAKAMAGRWDGDTRPLTADPVRADLIVDALFGVGLSKPLDSRAGAWARRRGQVVAVDIPSGLSTDSGQPVGPDAFHAVLTVTFHRKKPAHVLETGRTYSGDVVVADIGMGETPSDLHENQPELWRSRMHWPSTATHKHSRGRLAVVSGPAWNTGAARLAARGGLRIGAGFVTILSPLDSLMVNAAHLEAIVLRPFDGIAQLSEQAQTADAAVIGPAAGVGPGTAAQVFALVQTGAAMVIDADALTSFKDDPKRLFGVLDRDDVLTPHGGEFERIFPGLAGAGPDKVTAARRAAELAGCVILFKGPDTVIAAPDGRCAVNVNAPPWLATAGSGDVLAGFVAGLIAQGMESFEAACAAVWIHGEAASAHGPGLTAEDLPGLAPAVLKQLYLARG
ncbi:MAG: yjeF family protein [Caulobacteraceae bacterium]|nr:yjeF family protein [Caulobacteraceae bacterium]